MVQHTGGIMTERVFSGSINAMKEVARLLSILRQIEAITNSEGEHDSDYSAVCDKVNAMACDGLRPTV
jgi:hypothetical protein